MKPQLLASSLLAIILCFGCDQPEVPSAPSFSPQDTYLKEAEVLERMYIECDRLELEKQRHHKFAEDRLKLVEGAEGKDDTANAEIWRQQMNTSKEDEVMAEAEIGSIRRAIPTQRQRVTKARHALGLSDR